MARRDLRGEGRASLRMSRDAESWMESLGELRRVERVDTARVVAARARSCSRWSSKAARAAAVGLECVEGIGG